MSTKFALEMNDEAAEEPGTERTEGTKMANGTKGTNVDEPEEFQSIYVPCVRCVTFSPAPWSASFSIFLCQAGEARDKIGMANEHGGADETPQERR